MSIRNQKIFKYRFTIVSTKYQRYIIFDIKQLTYNNADMISCYLEILSPDIVVSKKSYNINLSMLSSKVQVLLKFYVGRYFHRLQMVYSHEIGYQRLIRSQERTLSYILSIQYIVINLFQHFVKYFIVARTFFMEMHIHYTLLWIIRTLKISFSKPQHFLRSKKCLNNLIFPFL